MYFHALKSKLNLNRVNLLCTIFLHIWSWYTCKLQTVCFLDNLMLWKSSKHAHVLYMELHYCWNFVKADCNKTIIKLKSSLTALMNRGRFHLHNWVQRVLLCLEIIQHSSSFYYQKLPSFLKQYVMKCIFTPLLEKWSSEIPAAVFYNLYPSTFHTFTNTWKHILYNIILNHLDKSGVLRSFTRLLFHL